MAEEIRDDLQSILIEKKKGSWDEGCFKHNFTLPSELTVTITLDEYRMLVKHEAARQAIIDKKEKERMDYYFENEKLKKENASLKEKLLKYVTEDQTEEKTEEKES